MNIYDVGDKPRLRVTYAADDGTAVDPITVTCSVRSPSGVSTPSVTTDGVGSYYADVPLTASGTWSYRWLAVGNVDEAVERSFYVRPRAV